MRLHVTGPDPWISFTAIMLLAIAVRDLDEQPAHKLLLRLLSPPIA